MPFTVIHAPSRRVTAWRSSYNPGRLCTGSAPAAAPYRAEAGLFLCSCGNRPAGPRTPRCLAAGIDPDIPPEGRETDDILPLPAGGHGPSDLPASVLSRTSDNSAYSFLYDPVFLFGKTVFNESAFLSSFPCAMLAHHRQQPSIRPVRRFSSPSA